VNRAVLFDLDGTLFDRDVAVRSLSETQYVAFERELTGVSREPFVSRLLELDAHGLATRRSSTNVFFLNSTFRKVSRRSLLRISRGAITVSVCRFPMPSTRSCSFVLVARYDRRPSDSPLTRHEFDIGGGGCSQTGPSNVRTGGGTIGRSAARVLPCWRSP
jgi:hypothetical protein